MTTFRKIRFGFWLCLAAASVTLLLPAAALATTNVVPNPGFEQGGCGSTPIICGWHGYDGFIARDTTNPHSGSASMSLTCGPFPCYPDPDGNLLAATDFTSCPPIAPGTHPASFWYRAGPEVLVVALEAVFYQGPSCAGLPFANDSINGSAIGDDAWHELAGGLVAPPGTESVWFLVGAALVCDYSGCLTGANFDDLDVESESENIPPVARFSFSCTALACSFDGRGSSDPDGSVATYSWNFGDGTSGSGSTITHSYVQPAGYLVTLTVTDNDAATGTDSKTITLISLSARGYKVRGLQKVDLAWSGPGGSSFDVYRNGGRIATVQGSAYTDSLNTRGSGSYVYKLCAVVSSTCSNEVPVAF